MLSGAATAFDDLAAVSGPAPSENSWSRARASIAEGVLRLADARANHWFSAGFSEGNALALEVAGRATDGSWTAVPGAVLAVQGRASDVAVDTDHRTPATGAALLARGAAWGAGCFPRICRDSCIVSNANDIGAVHRGWDAGFAVLAAPLSIGAADEVADAVGHAAVGRAGIGGRTRIDG